MRLTDDNLPEKDKVVFLLPTGERVIDKTTYSFDTTELDDGQYEISISGTDKAGNLITRDLTFTVDHTIVDKPKISESEEFDPILILIIVGIAIAIIVGIVFSQKKRTAITNQ